MCRLLLGFARFCKVAQEQKSMGLGFLVGVTYVQTSAWFRTFRQSGPKAKIHGFRIFGGRDLCADFCLVSHVSAK
jgi:hypothetical protein